MKKRNYIVKGLDGPDDDYELVVAAWNEGAAIEWAMACRGMLRYDDPPMVTRTDKPAQEDSTKEISTSEAWHLQEHHRWRRN